MTPAADHPGIEPAEQAAAILTAAGMPRMPARVMMALVGSPDAGYTAGELGERLGVSAAAVSGAVRYLQSLQLIQRLSRPGERLTRYDLVDDAWHATITANIPMYEKLASLIDTVADDNSRAAASVARARDMAAFFRYMTKRLPELIADWDEERSGTIGERSRFPVISIGRSITSEDVTHALDDE